MVHIRSLEQETKNRMYYWTFSMRGQYSLSLSVSLDSEMG